MSRDEQVHIRCTKKEKRTWEKAASQDDRSLAAWLRVLANKAAEEQLESPDSKKG